LEVINKKIKIKVEENKIKEENEKANFCEVDLNEEDDVIQKYVIEVKETRQMNELIGKVVIKKENLISNCLSKFLPYDSKIGDIFEEDRFRKHNHFNDIVDGSTLFSLPWDNTQSKKFILNLFS